MKLRKNFIHTGICFLLIGALLATSLWGTSGSKAMAAPKTDYKTSIKVLIIEPTKYSGDARENTIRSWIGESDSTSPVEEIDIDLMSLAEFVGTNVDLRGTYDLIYIGAGDGPRTANGKLNTETEGNTPLYNDKEELPDGMIYTHIGDTVQIENSSTGELMETRYSGRDLTLKKVEELQAYVDAGYPLLVSSGLYNGEIIANGKVKSGSNMRSFLDSCVSSGKAVKAGSNVDAVNAMAHIPKLQMTTFTTPKEYAIAYNEDSNGTTIKEVTALQRNKGLDTYTLEYVFEFTDTTRSADETVYYEVQLFVDKNADGKLEDFEEVYGLDVLDAAGRKIGADAIVPGIRYTLTKELTSEYQGLITWELRINAVGVVENGENVIGNELTTSKIGQSCIWPVEKTEINVLHLAAPDSVSVAENEIVKTLIENLNVLNIYDIQITTMDQSTYLNQCAVLETGLECYENIFHKNKYDIVLVGFEENYLDKCKDVEDSDSVKGSDVVDKSIEALEWFIKSGKSVMFTYDAMSWEHNEYTGEEDNYWSYRLNQLALKYAAAEGLADRYLDIVAKTDENYPYRSVHYSGKIQSSTNYISQVNKGQITSYPYDLNILDGNVLGTWAFNYLFDYPMITLAKKEVETTYAPHYRIDLENPDLNVWFALASKDSDSALFTDENSETFHDAVPNDTCSDYYMYSVENVVYSGMRGTSDMTTYEAKLFVNALVAMYNLGAKDPVVSIVEAPDVSEDGEVSGDLNAEVEYIYRMYDEDSEGNEESLDQDSMTIFFYLDDPNVIGGDKATFVTWTYKKIYTNKDYEADIDGLDYTPVGELGNSKYQAIVIDSETIEKMFEPKSFTNSEGDPVTEDVREIELIIKAETWLAGEGNLGITIAEATDSVIIKKVGLFNLD